MEKAIGGLPQYDSIEAMIAKMDEAGVDKVFITQCKMWSYRNKWMYMDTKLEEVAQYTNRYPGRFVGLASYNPFRIKGIAAGARTGDQEYYGFKGVYIHIYGFDIPLHDAKMYPLYAKCVSSTMSVCRCKSAMSSKQCPASMPGRSTWIASPAIFPNSKSSVRTRAGPGSRS